MTAPSWPDLTLNPEAITRLYPDAPPSLRGVHLSEVSLHRDGPRMSLHVLLADFPARPPARWARERCNAVALQLDLFDVADVDLAGWSTDNIADLDLARAPDGRISVRADAAPLRLRVTCHSLRVAHVTGYIRSTPP